MAGWKMGMDGIKVHLDRVTTNNDFITDCVSANDIAGSKIKAYTTTKASEISFELVKICTATSKLHSLPHSN